MKLQELAVANPIQQAAKVFESYFGNRVDFNTVSRGQARDMLKRVRGLIAEHRRTPEFHRSERNPSYLKLVMMEQALTAAATTPGAANPQAQAGMQAAQIQQKKKQIQDAIKAKQGEIAQLQKQMNDPTMMAMTEAQLDELSPATLTSYAGKRSGQAAWAGGAAKQLGGRPPERPYYRDSNETDPETNYGAQGNKYAKFNQQARSNIKKAIGKGATPNTQPYNQAAQAAQGAYGDASNPVTRKKGVAEGSRARRLREASEIQQAQVVLASQDMVDQVQKMSEQVSAMQFKDLPALLDQIRNEVGVDQATQYNADASAALSGLLGNLQGAKQQLEAALGVITGQAPQVPGAEMAAAPDMGADMGAELPAPGEEEIDDLDAAGADLDAAAQAAGLGRERR
jgi:hypothetical protein